MQHATTAMGSHLGPFAPNARRGGALLTTALVAINTGMFLLEEWWGGSESTRTLVNMGAIFSKAPPSLLWPSLLTYGYLHVGALHLGMNMFGLWHIGRALEPMLGPSRFFLLYTVSLLGGGVAIAQGSNAQVTAGASGALFGLLGAICALLLGSYRRTDSPAERAGIRGMIVRMLAPNLLISLLPGVSLMGHAGGLVVGAATMSLMTAGRRPRTSPEMPSSGSVAAAVGLAAATLAAMGWIWWVCAPWLD